MSVWADRCLLFSFSLTGSWSLLFLIANDGAVQLQRSSVCVCVYATLFETLLPL